jgi:hypothetical protein
MDLDTDNVQATLGKVKVFDAGNLANRREFADFRDGS